MLEPLSGYVLLAAELRNSPVSFAGSWNFGPATSDVRTVQDVAEAINSHLNGSGVEVVGSVGSQHEARLLQLNCDKAQQLLGWYPRWTVDKTLDATAEWYRAILNGAKAEQVTRAQLHDYFPEIA